MTVIKDCPKCGGWGRVWRPLATAKYVDTNTGFRWIDGKAEIAEVCQICKGKGKIETKDYEG